MSEKATFTRDEIGEIISKNERLTKQLAASKAREQWLAEKLAKHYQGTYPIPGLSDSAHWLAKAQEVADGSV